MKRFKLYSILRLQNADMICLHINGITNGIRLIRESMIVNPSRVELDTIYHSEMINNEVWNVVADCDVLGFESTKDDEGTIDLYVVVQATKGDLD